MARHSCCAALFLVGGLMALPPRPAIAQETAEAKAEPAADDGYRLKVTIEADLDWLSLDKPKPAEPADNAKRLEPSRPPRRFGGKLIGKFTATWSLEPKTSAPSEHSPEPKSDQKPESKDEAGDPADLDLTDEERDIIKFTNQQREKARLPAFKPDPVLMKMAREQSAAMARLEKLAHELEGRSFNKRLTESKFNAQAAGENCAEGAESATQAVDDWMTSPGHRANILNDRFTHIGVAMRKAKNGRRYWTQVFAKPF